MIMALLLLAGDEVITIPTHSDTMLYLMNGGAIVSIIGLTLWLIKTDMPRREARNAEEREKLRLEFSSLLSKLIDNFRTDAQLLTKTFSDALNREQDAHTRETQFIAESFERVITRIENKLDKLDKE